MIQEATVEIEKDPKEVLFTVKVNGQKVMHTKSFFIATHYLNAITEALLIVGLSVKRNRGDL